MAKRKVRVAYHPIYWPIWMLYPLLRLITLLPPRWLFRWGEAIGKLLPKFSKRLEHITDVNLQLCYPELSEQDRKSLANKNYAAIGRSIFETLIAWFAPRSTIKKLGHIQGVEHIHTALAKGKGLIVVAAHFSCSELIGAISAQQYKFFAVYQAIKNPALDRLAHHGRSQYVTQLIASHRIRSILHALSDNQIVWFAPDQNTQKKRRTVAPFFNHQIASSTMVTRLVELSGADVLFLSSARQADGSYLGKVMPAINYPSPSHDIAHDATIYNQYLEKEIRAYPDQYLWSYKFFKKNQKGEASVYKSNKELKKTK